MKKFFCFVIFLISFTLVSAQNNNDTQPMPTSVSTAACNQQADRLLVSEWNSGSVLALCQDYTNKTVVKATVPATTIQQLLPAPDEDYFYSYSASGKLRYHTPQTANTPEVVYQWLIPAGGRLTNEGRSGLILVHPWEREKWQITLFHDGWYDAIRVDPGIICTAEAATGSLHACVQGNNKVVTISRQSDFAGSREYRQLSFEQFPVGHTKPIPGIFL